MNKYLLPLSRWLAALIMLQTLYFKFSAHPDSVMLFTELGLEPIGRIGTGVVELFASALLLWRAWSWLGGFLGIGLMAGAIFFHITQLGIVFNNDGGLLFTLATITLLSCAYIAYCQKEKWLPIIGIKVAPMKTS